MENLLLTAKTVPDSLQQVAILGALSKAYILREDYQQAYAYEEQSNDLRNRIFTSQKEQEVGRLHAQTALHQQALVRAEQEIVVKDMALEESTKLLDVKNILIENLQMRLTENQPKAESLNTAQLGNLKILTTEDWHTFRLLKGFKSINFPKVITRNM
jgi:hypothetical protein